MWISRTSLALALLAGCNWVYGLDATTLGVDTDGDAIVDGIDNCPTIANPDQLDSNTFDEGGDACAQCPDVIGIDLDEDNYDDGCDRCLGAGPNGEDVDDDGLDDGCDPCIAGVSQFAIDFNGNGIGDGCEVCFEPPKGDDDQDGLDDACDTCSSGPPHDEDGDGIDDGCDNCPLDPNPDQAAKAGSPVGAACDHNILIKISRTFFDPFLVRDIFHWTLSGSWSQVADRTTAGSIGGRTITASFTGEFRFMMRARLMTASSSVSATQDNGTPQTCTVRRDGTVTFNTASTSIAIGDAPITVELYYSANDITAVTRCLVSSQGQNVGLSGAQTNESSRIMIGASDSELYAVDLVAEPPKPPTN